MSVLDGERPLLMAIVGATGAESAAGALRGGADLVQIRAKELSGRDLVRLVRSVIDAVGGADRIIVNSHPDIASLTGCLGVHLPESGLDPVEVRRVYPGLLIGVSRHDRAGLERAIEQRADYAILGPVFPTPGKESRALGLELARESVRRLPLPALAVGGISLDNAAEVTGAGFAGAAVIRPFENASGAEPIAGLFKSALGTRRNPYLP